MRQADNENIQSGFVVWCLYRGKPWPALVKNVYRKKEAVTKITYAFFPLVKHGRDPVFNSSHLKNFIPLDTDESSLPDNTAQLKAAYDAACDHLTAHPEVWWGPANSTQKPVQKPLAPKSSLKKSPVKRKAPTEDKPKDTSAPKPTKATAKVGKEKSKDKEKEQPLVSSLQSKRKRTEPRKVEQEKEEKEEQKQTVTQEAEGPGVEKVDKEIEKKDEQRQPSVEKTDRETEDEPAASEEADLILGTV